MTGFLNKMISLKRYAYISLIIISILAPVKRAASQDDNNRRRNFSIPEGNGTLSGIVYDGDNNQPLEGAVIGVYKMRDSTKVKGAETDKQGKFSFEIPYGIYKVEVNFVGYSVSTVNRVAILPKKPDIVLDTIKLSQGTTETEEIEVTSQRSSLEILPDKKVFHVGQDVIDNGGDATDVLKNVPSVSVDVDGNVSLRGSADVKILVDGKPSGLNGDNESQILEQIPANLIESIELITNPSAKYEAESSSGIINIILKKNTGAFGKSGNFSLGTGTKDKYNGSVGLTLKNDVINAYANYNFRLFNFGMNGTSSRDDLFNNSFLDQTTNSANRNQSQFAKLGLDYNINPKNTLSLSGTFNLRKRTNNSYTLDNDLDAVQTLTDYSINKSNSTGNGYGMDISLNYNGTFKSPQQTLTGEISYSRSKDDNASDIFLRQYYPDGVPFSDFANLQNTTTNSLLNYFNVQLDYVQPFGGSGKRNKGKGNWLKGDNSDKGDNQDRRGNRDRGDRDRGSNDNSSRPHGPDTKLETGVRSIFRSTDNNYVNNYFDTTLNTWAFNSDLSNHFKYSEQIYAAYALFSSKIKDFGYQFGLRSEGTVAEGDLITSGQTFKNKYIDFFPNVNLAQKIDLADELQANYSRKINRPRLSTLNPFVNVSDPLNISVGNPNIKPEYADLYEFNYLRYFSTTTIEATFFYKQIHDNIVRSRILTDSGVTVTTFENLASSKSYGVELIGLSDITPWLSINGSASYFRSVLNGTLSVGEVNNTNYSWNGKLSATIKLWWGINMQYRYNYQGEYVTAQGSSQPVQTSDIAFKKDFLKGRATIAFRVSDLFNTQQFSVFTSGNGFTQTNYRKRDSRVAFLTFTLKIGDIKYKRIQNKKKKGDNNDDNNDNNDYGPDNDY